MKVTLTKPGIEGDDIVAERNLGGTLLLAPDTSAAAMRARLGVGPASPEEFERHFGHLARDGES